MGITESLNELIGFLLNWTMKYGDFGSIVIVSFILGFFTTLVYKYFTNQDALKKIKEENKRLQDEMKNHKDNPKRMAELQKEALQKSLIEPFKHQMKPLLITFAPFVLVFGWLRANFAGAGDIFLVFGWFGTYIIFSIIFSSLMRKMLRVY